MCTQHSQAREKDKAGDTEVLKHPIERVRFTQQHFSVNNSVYGLKKKQRFKKCKLLFLTKEMSYETF